MPTTVEIVASVAALISAVGTAAAAVSAARSASSSRESQRALNLQEKRSAVKNLYSKATEIETEYDRLDWITRELVTAYKIHFALAGRSAGERLYVEPAQKKLSEMKDLKNSRAMDSADIQKYYEASDDDILTVEIELSDILKTIKTARERAEHDLTSIESKSAQVREQKQTSRHLTSGST